MDVKEALLRADNAGRHPWEKARLRVVYSFLQRYVPHLFRTTGIIADVGCGDLFIIRSLSKKMPNIRFVGIDKALAELGISDGEDPLGNGKIALYSNMQNAFSGMNRPVDAVLLLDVIEHIDNEAAFLKQVISQPCINNDTAFIITAPAYQFLFSSHDVFLEHRRRYRLGKLHAILRKAGLQIDASGYFFFSLFSARLISVAAQRMAIKRGEAKGLSAWKSRPAIDKLIEQFLFIDYRFFSSIHFAGVHMPGLSSYAAGKKQR